MANPLPTHEAQFVRLAVKLGQVAPAAAMSAVELRRRYLAAGGEVPSLPRILVQKGHLQRGQAEGLLRHVVRGEPLPQGTGAAAAPTQSAEAVQGREAALKGLGATVLRGEIKGYKILQVIGEGSRGCVYRARQVSMDRIVALKVLTQVATQASVEQFLTEARNAGRLNHPNLIRVHEVARSGDLYYYSMEYVDGVTIAELMDEFEGGRLDPKRAVNIFLQVASALDHGYRLGIIHREIRPKSIMITEGDQAKLDGLGLIQAEAGRFLQAENAHYVAPEQVRGEEADTRTDIYCLGCCLFHALTGAAPFHGDTPRQVLAQHLLADAPDPRKLQPTIPEDLAGIARRMMAREPKDRYQTPAELVEAFKKVTFGPLPGVQPPGARPRFPVRPRLGRGRLPRRRFRR
jgi:serine/threonine-protein kinase